MDTKTVILLVSARKEELDPFIQGLQSGENVHLIQAETPEEALKTASSKGPAMAILDGSMGNDFGLDLAKEFLKLNAFINTAVMSDMDETVFHEKSEGLGVFAQLPLKPDGQHARALLFDFQKFLTGL
jgi:DNA-binding NtrC family response regulator